MRHVSEWNIEQNTVAVLRMDRRLMMTERLKEQEGHREQQWKGETEPEPEEWRG